MSRSENRRGGITLYANSICNLRCKYCFIEKFPELKLVDQMLEECYKSDYFFEFAKKLFPERENMLSMEIWGGEPTLSLDRLERTLIQMLQHFPNFSHVMFSTNMTAECCIDNIKHFIEVLNTCGHPIELDLQMSLDGTVSINDYNRGIGTTKNFIKNFTQLVLSIDDILLKNENVRINSHTKGTLSIENIEFLSKEDGSNLVEYYSFLNELQEFANKHSSCERFRFLACPPNTAVPMPITRDIGIKFATLCKNCRKLEETGRFPELKAGLTPFANSRNYNCGNHNCSNYGICGQGKCQFGMLPNDLVAFCHDSFVSLVQEHKEISHDDSLLVKEFFQVQDARKNPFIVPFSELEKTEEMIDNFYDVSQTNMKKSVISEIHLLANSGLINEKYKNLDAITDILDAYIEHSDFCIRDNWKINGTTLIIPTDIIILLLNGAEDYVLNYKKP